MLTILAIVSFYSYLFLVVPRTSQFLQLLQKAILCLVLIGMNPLNIGSHVLYQSIIFLFILSGPVAVNIFYPTYRCTATNYIKALLDM